MTAESNNYTDEQYRLEHIRVVASRYFAVGMKFTPYYDESTGQMTIQIDDGPYTGRVAEMLPATHSTGSYYFRKSDKSPI